MAQERYLIYLFIILFVFIPLVIFSQWRKNKLLKTFAHSPMLESLNSQASRWRAIFKSLLVMLAFAMIVIALCRPRWNPEPKTLHKSGRDVAILLDVSRSMLAEDLSPNRLARAKLAVRDLLEELRGDRVALITFAGSANIKCPLTQDYAFLRLALEDITTQSASVGGTNLGDAIRKTAAEVFDNKVKEFKDLILISDGGELEESLPIEAAKDAANMGIRIISIGLGDKISGARIPVFDQYGKKSYLMYDSQEVWTKLDDSILRKVALSTIDGKYIPVETGAFDLGQIYNGLIASANKRELEETTTIEYNEGFQYFLSIAFALLIIELLMSERNSVSLRKKTNSISKTTS